MSVCVHVPVHVLARVCVYVCVCYVHVSVYIVHTNARDAILLASPSITLHFIFGDKDSSPNTECALSG